MPITQCLASSPSGILLGRSGTGAQRRSTSLSRSTNREVVHLHPVVFRQRSDGTDDDRRVRHVPIVEAGWLSGIISIGDVVKNRLGEMEAEQRAMDEYSGGQSTPGSRF